MSIRKRILDLMQPGVKLTADEIAGALDLPVLSVRPRVCELSMKGVLIHCGEKPNRRMNSMLIWTRKANG